MPTVFIDLTQDSPCKSTSPNHIPRLQRFEDRRRSNRWPETDSLSFEMMISKERFAGPSTNQVPRLYTEQAHRDSMFPRRDRSNEHTCKSGCRRTDLYEAREDLRLDHTMSDNKLPNARCLEATDAARTGSSTTFSVREVMLRGIRSRLSGLPASQAIDQPSLKRKRGELESSSQHDHGEPDEPRSPVLGIKPLIRQQHPPLGSPDLNLLAHINKYSMQVDSEPKRCGHQPGPDPWGHLKVQCIECSRTVCLNSRKLQIVTGSKSTRIFRPQQPESSWAQAVEINEPIPFDCGVHFDELRHYLETASEERGFRSIELASCTFRAADRGFLSNKIGDWRYPNRKTRGPEDNLQPLTFKSSGLASLQLCETNITGPDGRTRTWMWIRIRKPLVHLQGPNMPEEMSTVPESEFILAVPSRKVAMLKDEYIACVEHLPTPPSRPAYVYRQSTVGPHGTPSPRPLSPNAQRKLTFQLSKDGIPTIGFSNKPTFATRVAGQEFLHVGGIGQFYLNPFGARRWWNKFHCKARLQRWHFQDVADAMSRFECILDVEGYKGADWVIWGPGQSIRRS